MCPALAALLLVAGCSKDNDPIPVSGVELGKSAIELAVGQTERLSVTVLPDDASDQVVTWGSNDEAVATVGDNGTVTAVAEGTATITATAGGKSAACTVMVTATPDDDADITAAFDPRFARVLQQKGYIADAEHIAFGEVKDIRTLRVDGTFAGYGLVTSLKGIEYFQSLEELSCYSNRLVSLDVSNNTKLTWLFCYSNQLTSLDVSNNTKLTWLSCYSNQLTSLDVSHNTKLTTLYYEDNPGNGVSIFPVTAWFDDSDIPSFISQASWTYDGNTITPVFTKAQ